VVYAIVILFIDSPITQNLVLQVAQLSQRKRETPYISWKLVNCCTAVQKIGRGCSRWM